MRKLFLIVFPFLLEVTAYSQSPGSLDLTFGGIGYVTTSVTKGNNYGQSVSVQPDGKIVVAGYSAENSDYDFALVRYNTNGQLDSSFGTEGKVITSVGKSNDQAYIVLVQPDGKIIATGFTTASFGSHDFALVRYNINGTFDSTFGKNGLVISYIRSFDDEIYTATLQPDGKIIVGGCSYDSLNADFVIARYNTDGTFDSTFGKNGVIITPVGLSDDKVFALAQQNDGKIIAAGNTVNGSYTYFAIVRYNADGTTDNSFGKNGISVTPFGKGYNYANSLSIQTDGKIVIAGYSYNESNDDFLIARYNTEGILDNSFGKEGIVITDIGGFNDAIEAVVIQSDGKIVVAGYSANNTYIDFAVARYNINGVIDHSFGNNGIVLTPVGSTYDYAHAVSIQTDGKIIVAGFSKNDSDNFDFAVARYIGTLK
ncbi:MAG: delta-60 repeat domain-containing protein [Bacteroidota bacterium]